MNELATIPAETNFMPVLTTGLAVQRFGTLVNFVKQVMREGVDYGTIPGTPKPTLLKPGAEKLTTLFGLSVKFQEIKVVEDWSGEGHGGEPFFFYHYQCQLYRGALLIAEADGSCNSRESKYRYRWVNERDVPAGMDKAKLAKRGGSISEFDFAIDKAETGGQYGKPAEYWSAFKIAIENGTARRTSRKTKTGKSMDAWEIDSTVYRVPNEDLPSQVNSIMKMAQKRAYVAATLIGCNASEFFTQDIEDMDLPEFAIEAKPDVKVEVKPNVGTVQAIRELLSEMGRDEASACRWASGNGKTSATELTHAEAEKLLGFVQKWKANHAPATVPDRGDAWEGPEDETRI